MRLNIGVIFGGKSVEHEISIISALSAIENMNDDKYQIIPIYIDKENTWYTGMHLKSILHYRDIDLVKRYAKKVSLVKRGKSFILESQDFFKKNLYVIDLVIPIGHGTFMEDGSLQGYLSMLGIPFTGSKVLASALGQDKVIQKDLFKEYEIPTCNYIWFYDYEFEKNRKNILKKIENLKYPLYIKPSSLGSSIGITLANDEKELIKGIKEAIKFDKKILIEEKINNLKEVNVSVLGNYETQSVSEIEEINSNEEFYSFKEKYVNDYSKGINKEKNAPLLKSKEMIEDIKNYAIKVFKIINASGVARIDFLIDDKNKKIYVNEINTNPGDLASYLWMTKKVSFEELIENLIKIAIKEKTKEDEKILAFDGNLLEGYDVGGSKIKK
ncbi:MAG: D-alanine--D-alanine ligase [bacterium]|nr:D-alanine--D-alanine ligase [bacterium]